MQQSGLGRSARLFIHWDVLLVLASWLTGLLTAMLWPRCHGEVSKKHVESLFGDGWARIHWAVRGA